MGRPKLTHILLSTTALLTFAALYLQGGLLKSASTGTGSLPKIRGANFVAPPQYIHSGEMAPLRDIHAQWVAIIPYAFSHAGRPDVNYDYPEQWWGEKRQGTIATLNYAKKLGLKTMLKPHTWVLGQGWAGDYELYSEKDWQTWEKSYERYILEYADVADSMEVDLFCIGTEYRKAVVQRPDFWDSLIEKVRSRYQGKLTYASNWDNYQKVSFWGKLDYIGVDAYFPLSESKTPDTDELIHAWDSVLHRLEAFQAQWEKPLLFTEYGYRSMDHTADGHWKYDESRLSPNPTAQSNAYEALYRVFWEKDWFAGGFLWKWHAKHQQVGGNQCKQFTPQNKKVSEIIKRWYGN